MFNNPPPEIRAVYEIIWKSTVEPDMPKMAVWRVRIAYWIAKSTNTHIHTHTHSEYATIIAFPLQQWLHERASFLRYKYITCLVNSTVTSIF